MPAQIVEVGGADGVANGAGHFEPDQVGQEEIAAGRAHLLRQRQRPGDQRGAGVRLGDESDVVVVEGVGHCAIDQGSVEGSGLEAPPYYSGRRLAAQAVHVVAKNVRQWLTGTGDGATQAVYDCGLGGVDGIRWKIFQASVSDVFSNSFS